MHLGHWVKHTLVYGLGVVLMNALPVVLIPIYTHRIPPSEYGVLELLNRSQEILILILSLGLRSTLLTFYQMAKDNPEKRKQTYSTALQILAVVGFGMVGVLLRFPGWLSRVLFNSPGYKNAVILILLSTYLEMMFQMAILYLQSELRSGWYVTTIVSRSLLAIALNLVLVFWWRWGLMGILWASLIHTGVGAIVTLIYLFRRTGWGFDKALAREMLRFGLPLVPAAMAMFILNNGDRYFLNIFATRTEVGIYGLAYRLGILCNTLVLLPFGKIWSVTMVDIAQRDDGPTELGKIATYLLAASVFSTLGLALLGPYLVRLLAPSSYWGADGIIPIVGAAYLFYAWTVIMDASFYVTKRTGYKPLILGISGGFIFLLYSLMIPRYGMVGAAWATLGGFACFAGVTAFFAQRVYRIHYQLMRVFILFVLGFLLYLVGNLCPIDQLFLGFIGRSAAIVAFPLVLWMAGFATEGERMQLHSLWNMTWSRLNLVFAKG